MIEPKLCCNCKHYRKERILGIPVKEFAKCAAEGKIDPVHGKPQVRFCSIARDFEHLCGRTGKWWEAK